MARKLRARSSSTYTKKVQLNWKSVCVWTVSSFSFRAPSITFEKIRRNSLSLFHASCELKSIFSPDFHTGSTPSSCSTTWYVGDSSFWSFHTCYGSLFAHRLIEFAFRLSVTSQSSSQISCSLSTKTSGI